MLIRKQRLTRIQDGDDITIIIIMNNVIEQLPLEIRVINTYFCRKRKELIQIILSIGEGIPIALYCPYVLIILC